MVVNVEQEVVVEVTIKERDDCKTCGAKLNHDKNSDQYDPEFCSGKCKNLLISNRVVGCKLCGIAPIINHETGLKEKADGTTWLAPLYQYCSEACKVAKRKGQEPNLGECAFCGNIRKSNSDFYDKDYCSGKCKIADGGEVPIVMPVGKFLNPEQVRLKDELDNLTKTLQQKKLDRDKVEKDSLNLRQKQYEALAHNDTESADKLETDFYKVLDERNKLDDYIELLQKKIIPRKLTEIEGAITATHKEAKDKALAAKPDYIRKFQQGLDVCDSVLKEWQKEMLASKASFNRNEKLLINFILTNDLRDCLKPRVKGKQIAKLSTKQAEPKPDVVAKVRPGKKCRQCGCPKKAEVNWSDKDFCSGKCKQVYDAIEEAGYVKD